MRKIKGKTVSFDFPDTELEELDSSVVLSITTLCPEKYVLIDTETGQVYVGSNQDNPYMPYTKIWKEQKQI